MGTRQIEVMERQVTRMALGEIERMLKEGLPSFAKDEDEDKWNTLTSTKAVFTEQEVNDMQSAAQALYNSNPHAGGIIDTMVNFIIGKKARIISLDEDPEVQEYWDEFVRTNNFDLRSREMVKRTLRDGEMFLRFFAPGKKTLIQKVVSLFSWKKESPRKFEGKVPKVRFVEPSEIVDQTGTWAYGIETDPEDVETPVAYYRKWTVGDGLNKGTLKDEKIPADEIIHSKILVDSNVKRGISFLTRVAKWIKGYEEWIEDRRYLNKIRTMFYLIKKVSGVSPSTFVSQTGQNATTQPTGGGSTAKKMPKRGSIIVSTPNVEYDFPDLKIQAADTKDDGRALLLMIVAGINLAEYMVTGDASNANMASTWVSESPAVRSFEAWQDFFEKDFRAVYEKVVRYGIENRHLPEQSKKTVTTTDPETKEETEDTEEVPTSTECQVDFATLISRKLKEDTEAYQVHRANNWASDRTISGKLGYDYDEEQKQIAKEETQRRGQEPELEPSTTEE